MTVVKPKIARRCGISLLVGAAGAFLAFLIDMPWLYLVAALAVGTCVYDLASIQSTKRAISDLSVVVSDNALIMRLQSKDIAINYPWASLRIVKESEDEPSITIEDTERRRNHILLVGYEEMEELIGEIHRRSNT